MKTLWIVFTESKRNIEDVVNHEHSYGIEDIWFEYDKYDKKINIKLPSPLDERANDHALLLEEKGLTQFYIEEWDPTTFEPGEFTRIGYGTFQGHIEGRIRVIDVIQEDELLETVEDIYRR